MFLFFSLSVFNYFDSFRFPDKPVAPRRRRVGAGVRPANGHPHPVIPVNNDMQVDPEEDDEDVADTASRRL